MYIRSIAVTGDHFAGNDEYLNAIPAVCQLRALDISQQPVTFFVGENGSGKSTLLEAIAVSYGFNPEGGSRNFNFASMETHSGLHRYIKLIREPIRPRDGFFLRAESFYNMASNIDQLDNDGDNQRGSSIIRSYGGRSLHHQSHGESFLSLVLNRLGGKGLYIFDEPEAALSPSRQLTLLSAIHQLVGAGSQILIATHSPILMAYPNAIIYRLNEDGIMPIAYKDTEHYQVTRNFLMNPARMLDILLDDRETE